MRSRSVATSEMKSAKKPTKNENNAAEKHGCRFVYINGLRVQSTLFKCAATLDDPKSHYLQTNLMFNQTESQNGSGVLKHPTVDTHRYCFVEKFWRASTAGAVHKP